MSSRPEPSSSLATDRLGSLEEVEELVRQFETTTLPHSMWNHRAHLCVAAWYLLELDDDEAVSRMRSGIQRYNRAQGIEISPMGGYHETLTLFWMEVVRRFLRKHAGDGEARLERINELIEAFAGRKKLFLEHYSPKRLWSREARARWVAPDLKPLC